MKIPAKEKLQAFEEDEAVYEGERDQHKQKHGFGIKKWTDGAIFIGEWKANQANGKGWLFHADGDTYAGDFVGDKASG